MSEPRYKSGHCLIAYQGWVQDIRYEVDNLSRVAVARSKRRQGFDQAETLVDAQKKVYFVIETDIVTSKNGSDLFHARTWQTEQAARIVVSGSNRTSEGQQILYGGMA